MPQTQLTWPQVFTWRLTRHRLIDRAAPEEFLNVASQIGCLHAQLMSSAELSAAARVDDIHPQTVQDALWKDHTLVKTWAMRGTLHLVPARDYPTYVAALDTRRAYQRPVWLRAFDVTLPELESIINAVRDALDGRALTREELASEVGRLTGSDRLKDKLLSGWGTFLKPAAFRGYLCFGPSQGQAVTFVRPDQWIGPWEPVDPDEAMRTLARLYISTYGPATHIDFAKWWGTDPAPAKRVVQSIRDEFEEVSIEGEKALALASELDAIKAMGENSTVRLVPHFDPYTVVTYSHREHLGDNRGRVYRKSAWISPVVLVNGRIAGVWKHDKAKNRVTATIDLFEDPTPKLKNQIEAEIERLTSFFDTRVEPVFGPVEVF
jgi:hypothetical protein